VNTAFSSSPQLRQALLHGGDAWWAVHLAGPMPELVVNAELSSSSSSGWLPMVLAERALRSVNLPLGPQLLRVCTGARRMQFWFAPRMLTAVQRARLEKTLPLWRTPRVLAALPQAQAFCARVRAAFVELTGRPGDDTLAALEALAEVTLTVEHSACVVPFSIDVRARPYALALPLTEERFRDAGSSVPGIGQARLRSTEALVREGMEEMERWLTACDYPHVMLVNAD
jgi:hypothetical protein